jgi:hypothetical protein
LIWTQGHGEAGSGTDRIVEPSRPLREIGLPKIRLDQRLRGPLAKAFGVAPKVPLEALAQGLNDLLVSAKLNAGRGRQGLGREIVGRRPQTPRNHADIAIPGILPGGPNLRNSVTHARLADDLNTRPTENRSHMARVGVDDIAREELVTNGEKACANRCHDWRDIHPALSKCQVSRPAELDVGRTPGPRV